MGKRKIIQVEDRLPLGQMIPLSIQHVFAMFGASVLVPILFGIHSGIVQQFQMLRQPDNLIISGHGIDSAVHTDIVSVCVFHCAPQFIRRKISGKRSHAKVRSGQINCICSVEHCHLQPFHIPCRGQ